jgi:predicted thioesterase
VTSSDFARFETGEVHQVYSTFALARDAEWSGRLFVLEMKEIDEEGIGTGITVEHISPAMENEEVIFNATLLEVNGNEIITKYEATAGDRIIATGIQKQKIVRKEKLQRLFERLKQNT